MIDVEAWRDDIVEDDIALLAKSFQELTDHSLSIDRQSKLPQLGKQPDDLPCHEGNGCRSNSADELGTRCGRDEVSVPLQSGQQYDQHGP